MSSGVTHAADRTAISYSVSGQGPWLILSNSLATDRSMWAPQLPALEQIFSVVCYDTRGHGKSAVSETDFGFDALAADVVAIMETLAIDKARFVGLSMGGMTGLALALNHPERIETVVCCDARADAPDPYKAMWDANIALSEESGMEAVADATLPRWFSETYRSDPANSDQLKKVRAMVAETSVDGYGKAARCLQSLDLLRSLGDISVPVRFITGEFDPAAPVGVMQDMADRVSGSRLDVIPGAAHLSNIENPDAFLASITAALTD